MAKKVLLILSLNLLLLCFSAHAQKFSYTFKVTDVTNPAVAKQTINQLRDLMGVQLVRFDDSTDLFTVETPHDFVLPELIEKLGLNAVEVNGTIVKSTIE